MKKIYFSQIMIFLLIFSFTAVFHLQAGDKQKLASVANKKEIQPVSLSSAVLKSSFLFFKGLRVLPPQILHYILYKNRTIRDLYSQPC
ncbi:MAG: hypothetical protein AB1498_01860, partial [bacterium]